MIFQDSFIELGKVSNFRKTTLESFNSASNDLLREKGWLWRENNYTPYVRLVSALPPFQSLIRASFKALNLISLGESSYNTSSP